MGSKAGLICIFMAFSPGVQGTVCSKTILDDVLGQSTGQGFQETRGVQALDEFAKMDVLRELGMDMDEDRLLLDIGFVTDAEEQRRLLLQNGYDPDLIARLEERGMLQSDPLERLYLTSLPPAHGPHIRPGAEISRPNGQGYLENVTVERIEGDIIHVVLRDADETEFLETIGRAEAHQPIHFLQEVLITTDDGFPIRARIHDTYGSYATLTFDPQTIYRMDELTIRPRAAISTGRRDLSVPIGRTVLDGLDADYDELVRTYKSEGYSARFIERNNIFIRKLQREMYRQGISTSAVAEDIDIKEGNETVLGLRLNGIHQGGNHIARLYAKMAEQQYASSLFFSIAPFVPTGMLGYYLMQRVEVGYGAVSALIRKIKVETSPHEITHHMHSENRLRYGRTSPLDHRIIAQYGSARRNLYGNHITAPSDIYGYHMSFEEIYNSIRDASSFVGTLSRSSSERILDPMDPKMRDDIPVLSVLIETIDQIAIHTGNASNLVDAVIANIDNLGGAIFQRDGNILQIADRHFRQLRLILPNGFDTDELRSYLVSLRGTLNFIAGQIHRVRSTLEEPWEPEQHRERYRRLAREMLKLRLLSQTILNS